MKAFRTWNEEESWLLPRVPRAWLRPDHLVYCSLDVLPELDLSTIEGRYQDRDARAEKIAHPRFRGAVRWPRDSFGPCQ